MKLISSLLTIFLISCTPAETDEFSAELSELAPSDRVEPCGVSTPVALGMLGGYYGTTDLCRQTCGSKTAHMCTIWEMVEFAAAGGVAPGADAWVLSGIPLDGSGSEIADCNGFRTASDPGAGVKWSGSGEYAFRAACNPGDPPSVVYCCDAPGPLGPTLGRVTPY